MTSNRERLILDAAKAMADANPEAAWEDLTEIERDWYLRDARAALTVFESRALNVRDREKTHIPGFKKREKQAEQAWRKFTYTDREMPHLFRAGYHHGVIDQGRRTVQGEPTERVIVMCARCGLLPVVASDHINSDVVVCDRCAFAEGRESAQGEPSDAQVIEAVHAIGLRGFHVTAAAMRAALRAAAAVREEGQSHE